MGVQKKAEKPGGGRSRTAPDRVLGAVGVGMIVAAVLLLLFGGPGDAGAGDPSAPPALVLVEPTSGATLENPLRLTFRSGSPLARGPGGWGTGAYHLHASLEGRELMPGPDDVRPAGDGTFEWTIGTVPAGEHRLRLFWSDNSHRPVEGAATPEIRVLVRK